MSFRDQMADNAFFIHKLSFINDETFQIEWLYGRQIWKVKKGFKERIKKGASLLRYRIKNFCHRLSARHGVFSTANLRSSTWGGINTDKKHNNYNPWYQCYQWLIFFLWRIQCGNGVKIRPKGRGAHQFSWWEDVLLMIISGKKSETEFSPPRDSPWIPVVFVWR